ncbi:MAG: DNA-directed RNA polymerase subunit beta', partial [Candidatus Colwellbacteria bacterium]|nr:DNA-directed RNA polymerase subunit beta' [Candidatus Colwellbacteria bacterium]
CDKCGVEVTRSAVRRERMGHIQLAAPVVHIWFLRSIPSRLGLVLNVPLMKLEKVVYYAAYIVTSVDENARKAALQEIDRELRARQKTEEEAAAELESAAAELRDVVSELRPGAIISESNFNNLSRRFAGVFTALSGAEGIRRVLEGIDLDREIKEIERGMRETDDAGRRQNLARRLKLFISMKRNNIRPEWMITTVLPVLPPDLRPMVALDGGRYATSDLNDLYRRVINRNTRLKKLIELNAPDIITVNEKRMLQDAVDALIDNTTKVGRAQLSARRRPLRSLADMIKGKQGRFRQNLLGKRVDYSGRSVIVVGPRLKYDECGLPKRMALELFKPFVVSKILERGLAYNVKNANRLIEAAPAEVWEILEEVISKRNVLLNRAPTLHRLGIQAFRPILTEDLTVRIPPLVCRGFNADFDGDMMAVHVPLTEEAQRESEELMLSSKNLLKPASGAPILGPWNDIVLGLYYLTMLVPDAKGAGKVFSSTDEALLALEFDSVSLHAPIQIGKDFQTTCGRLIFQGALPADFGPVYQVMSMPALTDLVSTVIERYGFDRAKPTLDALQELGFQYSTKSGITFGMGDLVRFDAKFEVLRESESEVAKVNSYYDEGLLTEKERERRVIDIWTRARSKIGGLLKSSFPTDNPIYTMVESGARGKWDNLNQMMGMRGLVQNPKGEIISLPVISSFREGLSPLEYFITVHGNRKGLVDTALKTAEAGYLTRRLVEVVQDVAVREADCKTRDGIEVRRADGMAFGYRLGDRLFSRTAFEDITDGETLVVRAGEVITRDVADVIERSSLQSVRVRSPITCRTLGGVCAKCYGSDLGRNHPVRIGEAVGIVAAQAIGEPGTQLTLRTTHLGGVARVDITMGLPRIEELFEARVPKGKAVLSELDGVVEAIEESSSHRTIRIRGLKKNARKEAIVEYEVPRNALLAVETHAAVQRGTLLTQGSVDLKELYGLQGKEAVYRYLVSEIQRVYKAEGEVIHDKHIEIVVRKMFSRVVVIASGESELVIGEVIDKSRFFETARALRLQEKTPPRARELLFGITRASLSAPGVLAPASFQETSRVLVAAAIEGRKDDLRGLKENVIIGRLLPLGATLRQELERATERGEALHY